jgi:Fe-S cluster assembly iron-binding protein IscA
MLTLTENAVRAIRSLTAQEGQAAGSGLRIMTSGNGVSTLQLSLAPSPLAGDEVVEEEGARVFVEPAAVGVLDGKALDAAVDDDGGVAFSLARHNSPDS